MGVSQSEEMELSQFTSSLIRDVFDATLMAFSYQNEQHVEMQKMSRLSDQEIVEKHLTDLVLEEQLIELFGYSKNNPLFSAVQPGQLYLSETNERVESPAIYACVGIVLQDEDLQKNGRDFLISDQGYQKIKNAIQGEMLNKFKNQMIRLSKLGMPCIRIEEGRILSKMSFRMSETHLAETALRKMVIKPATQRGPEILNKRLTAYSEMEIKYKIDYR